MLQEYCADALTVQLLVDQQGHLRRAGGVDLAVAIPRTCPPCSATNDHLVDEGVHTRWTKASPADRFTEKKRR